MGRHQHIHDLATSNGYPAQVALPGLCCRPLEDPASADVRTVADDPFDGHRGLNEEARRWRRLRFSKEALGLVERPILYRQGDVLLRAVNAIPVTAAPIERDLGRVILAYGEITGHAHAIDAPEAEATLLSTSENQRFLRLMADADLVHEEHATIQVPSGFYEVVLQREWTDENDDQRERERWRFD